MEEDGEGTRGLILLCNTICASSHFYFGLDDILFSVARHTNPVYQDIQNLSLEVVHS